MPCLNVLSPIVGASSFFYDQMLSICIVSLSYAMLYSYAKLRVWRSGARKPVLSTLSELITLGVHLLGLSHGSWTCFFCSFISL